MIKLKQAKKEKPAALPEASPEVKLIPSPTSGIVPPVEHRWKKGESGNLLGRPKLMKSAYERKMMEPVMIEENVLDEKTQKIKKIKRLGTRAEQIASRMMTEATSKFRLGCAGAQLGAAQELRKVVEPTEIEEQGNIDRELAKLVVGALLSRQVPAEKQVPVIEV